MRSIVCVGSRSTLWSLGGQGRNSSFWQRVTRGSVAVCEVVGRAYRIANFSFDVRI